MARGKRAFGPHSVLLCLLAVAALTQAQANTAALREPVVILGASETGAYGKLIGLFEKHALREAAACAGKASVEQASSGSTTRQDTAAAGAKQSCSLLSELAFEHKSTNGSRDNLQRLGMPCLDCEAPMDNPEQVLALVQNYYVFQASRGELEGFGHFDALRSVLPMYSSPVQIVSAVPLQPDAAASPDITLSSDITALAGKRVLLGKRDSANEIHGPQFLDEHPMLNGVVYVCSDRDKSTGQFTLERCGSTEVTATPVVVEGTFSRALSSAELLACGMVDAYVVSGTYQRPQRISCPEGIELTVDPGSRTRRSPGLRFQLEIPELIIDKVVQTKELAYYQKGPRPDALARLPGDFDFGNLSEERRRELQRYRFEGAMPFVTAYLVALSQDGALNGLKRLLNQPAGNDELVSRVAGALVDSWTDFRLEGISGADLPPISENLLRKPAPTHPGATRALIERGMIGDSNFLAWILLLGILGVMLMMAPRAAYNRLGRSTRSVWHENLADFGLLVWVVLVTAIVLIIGVWGVQHLETEHAAIANERDRIGNFDFLQALMWMFTFVASGYENDVFPDSGVARLVVALFAFAGLGLPLWLIIGIVNRLRERSEGKARGLREQKRLKGHTLICGWNSKAPGLIYTLTCRDSPHTGKVLIVADPPDGKPLETWRFNRRVRFLRGDPCKTSVLERAQAHKAAAAVVLADPNLRAGDEQPGVLTALTLRKLQSKMFIAAELALKKDQALFAASHVDQIVDPELISRRMLALACVSPEAIDYVLDALSPDDQAEWYSLAVADVFGNAGGQRTVEDCVKRLYRDGISVLGVASGAKPTNLTEIFSPEFNEDGQLMALTEPADLAAPLDPSGFVICAAKDLDAYRKARKRSREGNRGLSGQFEVRAVPEHILPPPPSASRILVIGPENRAELLRGYLARNVDSLEVEAAFIDQQEDVGAANERLRSKIMAKAWSEIIIMSDLRESGHAVGASALDARTVLTAHLIEETLRTRTPAGAGPQARIVAEVHEAENQQLLMEAGVDTVVPTSLLAERFLARLPAGRGYVATMLSAMVSMENGVFIRSFTLPEGHPLVGRTFVESLTDFFADGRLIGVRPMRSEAKLENRDRDFGSHFYMCPAKGSNPVLAAGDLVIVLGGTRRAPARDAAMAAAGA